MKSPNLASFSKHEGLLTGQTNIQRPLRCHTTVQIHQYLHHFPHRLFLHRYPRLHSPKQRSMVVEEFVDSDMWGRSWWCGVGSSWWCYGGWVVAGGGASGGRW
ncbi:hypothetical protein HanPSC8_Chr17g0790901 [Helianthus annuus]|nr:hypothetical protein HanPSC8_Chr17g0790901 [Helianthus annuus]